MAAPIVGAGAQQAISSPMNATGRTVMPKLCARSKRMASGNFFAAAGTIPTGLASFTHKRGDASLVAAKLPNRRNRSVMSLSDAPKNRRCRFAQLQAVAGWFRLLR